MKSMLLLIMVMGVLSPRGFTEEDGGPSIVVVVPERIGEDRYWAGQDSNQILLVQGEIEKQLLRQGLDVRDVNGLDPRVEGGGWNWQALTVKSGALEVARQAEADYLVYGQATAVRAGQGNAYGVTAVRAQGNVVVRLVRVADGRVLGVFDGEGLEGDQAFGIAAKRALRAAAEPVAKEVAAAAKDLE